MPQRQSSVSFLITAEHASATVPAAWAAPFKKQASVLTTHRAWDPGSRELARALAKRLNAHCLEGQVSRLLIDLNRSANHPRLFSEFSQRLPAGDRQTLMRDYWQPHWDHYAQLIRKHPGQVVHLACHSFTPILDGQVRTGDIGLLYDPTRAGERAWCQQLKAALVEHLPQLRVRRNYPYRGTSNGLGQQHRRRFGEDKLITLEIEVNAALVQQPEWPQTMDLLVAAVAQAAEHWP